MKGNWVEELPNILWANQITPRRSKGETPFSMIYSAKVVISVKVSLSSSRVAGFTQGHNNECMVGNLDALEEWKDMVAVRLANYQQRLAQGYNRRVKPQEFVLGDLVLRKAIRSAKDKSARKLAPNWKGPYWVTTMARAGAYYLEDLEEIPLPRPWNIYNLKKYCQWM